MAVETIPQKVLHNGTRMAADPAYYVRQSGEWVPTSWATYADEVKEAGRALMALGVASGDTVTILGFNRPEWVIMDVAAMAVGAVPAGIYTTNSPEECKYIINHAESVVLLAENEDQWKKIDSVRDQLPSLRQVVMMKGAVDIDDALVLSWDEFITKASETSEEDFQARADALEMDQLGTLIYTSGTTGPPKAVMLSHDNMAWTASQGAAAFQLTSADSNISYLPLSHIAEQMFTIHIPTTVGSAVYYAVSIDDLADNLKEVQPTVFAAVPRVWEKFYSGVTAQLEHAEGAKAKIAAWAMDVGRKANAARNAGGKPSGFLGAQEVAADRLVLGKVREALGLKNGRVLVTAAAPLSIDIKEYFSAFVVINEVYGQSEDTGPTAMTTPGRTKFASVGPAYPGVEVKIADDGEILVKGRNVFLGYYKDPDATAATLVDGWLYSGDLGEFDGDGYLYITGRKKDIIITAGGKNVAPIPMESALKNLDIVSEAVVIGDRRKFLSVLVSLDAEAAAKYMADNGLSGDPHDSPDIRAEIQQAVDAMNANYARVEQIKKFTVLPRELSIEGGELTPTLKVKRNKVAEHFSSEIDAMYAE